MRNKFRILLAGLIFLLGLSALLVIQLLIPRWVTRPVVTMARMVPSHEVITADDVAIIRVSKDQLPGRRIIALQTVIGKRATVDLTPGVMLTEPFVDMDELLPGTGEVIFPVPRTAIYAVNGSLRAKDKVDILLYLPSAKQQKKQAEDRSLQQMLTEANGETSEPSSLSLSGNTVFQGIRVVGARSEAGNMVRDTELGNTNDRLTATDRIGSVELLMTNDQAEQLKTYMEQDYLIWFVRAS